MGYTGVVKKNLRKEFLRMAHCEKITARSAMNVMQEITRYWKDKSHYKNDVDLSRSHLNYQLTDMGDSQEDSPHKISKRTATQLTQKMHNRMSELEYRKRKDTVGLCSWVVTCPPELLDDEQKQAHFFRFVYDFTTRRYGWENMLPGTVHNDEATPHIHMPFVPVVDGKKLGANALMKKQELREYQQELEKECEQEFGIKGLILNGRTKGDYTLEELKERTRKEQELTQREQAVMQKEQALAQREQELAEIADEIEDIKERERIKKKLEKTRRFDRAITETSVKATTSPSESVSAFNKDRYTPKPSKASESVSEASTSRYSNCDIDISSIVNKQLDNYEKGL